MNGLSHKAVTAAQYVWAKATPLEQSIPVAGEGKYFLFEFKSGAGYIPPLFDHLSTVESCSAFAKAGPLDQRRIHGKPVLHHFYRRCFSES